MQWIRNPTSKQLGNAMTDELLQTAAMLFTRKKKRRKKKELFNHIDGL